MREKERKIEEREEERLMVRERVCGRPGRKLEEDGREIAEEMGERNTENVRMRGREEKEEGRWC